MLAVVFIRLDNSITPVMVPVTNTGSGVVPLKSQFEITTPDYYEDYSDAVKDEESEDEPVGGIDHLYKVTNNLTDLVGKVNVNQAFFKEYINILRRKSVPVDLMDVVRICSFKVNCFTVKTFQFFVYIALNSNVKILLKYVLTDTYLFHIGENA